MKLLGAATSPSVSVPPCPPWSFCFFAVFVTFCSISAPLLPPCCVQLPSHHMNKHTTYTSETEPTPAPALPWSRRVRAIVSVLIALHIVAAFSAPWSSPPPASELSRLVARQFEPYLFGAYLNMQIAYLLSILRHRPP